MWDYSTSPWACHLSLCSPALDGRKVLTGSLCVQTSQNLVQALGSLDNLTGMGKHVADCFWLFRLIFCQMCGRMCGDPQLIQTPESSTLFKVESFPDLCWAKSMWEPEASSSINIKNKQCCQEGSSGVLSKIITIKRNKTNYSNISSLIYFSSIRGTSYWKMRNFIKYFVMAGYYCFFQGGG